MEPKVDYRLSNLKRELRRYEKRLQTSLELKKNRISQGRAVSQTTLRSIENNSEWVKHYQSKIEVLLRNEN